MMETITKSNIEKCGICGGNLISVYRPTNSEKSVLLCGKCSTFQTLPRDEHDNLPVSKSHDAGWGGLRYGKEFSAQKAVEMISKHIIWERAFSVLDIGANRGAFVRALKNTTPTISSILSFSVVRYSTPGIKPSSYFRMRADYIIIRLVGCPPLSAT